MEPVINRAIANRQCVITGCTSIPSKRKFWDHINRAHLRKGTVEMHEVVRLTGGVPCLNCNLIFISTRGLNQHQHSLNCRGHPQFRSVRNNAPVDDSDNNEEMEINNNNNNNAIIEDNIGSIQQVVDPAPMNNNANLVHDNIEEMLVPVVMEVHADAPPVNENNNNDNNMILPQEQPEPAIQNNIVQPNQPAQPAAPVEPQFFGPLYQRAVQIPGIQNPEHTTGDVAFDRYFQMLMATMVFPVMPTTKPYDTRLVYKFFTKKAAALAQEFLLRPTNENLFLILVLPVIGMAWGELKGKYATTKERLNIYPFVGLPVLQQQPNMAAYSTEEQKLNRIEKAIGNGCFTRAGRMLDPRIDILKPTAEVMEIYKSKLPYEAPGAFTDGRIGPHPPQIRLELVKEQCLSFRKDTNPGLGGWSSQLLKAAMKEEVFETFMHSLTKSFIQGNTYNLDVLLLKACEGIMLSKPGQGAVRPPGAPLGIRPLGLMSTFGRVIRKTAVRHPKFRKEGDLLKVQLGVGTKGGVEPIIHQWNQHANQEPLPNDGDLKYGMQSLDNENAFNSIKNTCVAKALWDRGNRQFYRHHKAWSKRATPIGVRDGNEVVEVVWQTTGGQQGDPMMPYNFSIAVADSLEDIIRINKEYIPDDLPVYNRVSSNLNDASYIDDVNLYADITKSHLTLPRFQQVYTDRGTGLKINIPKSISTSLHVIKSSNEGAEVFGTKIYGTMIGNNTARRKFLTKKIEQAERELIRIQNLPAQVQLLLIRVSHNKKLCHLLRTLDHVGLEDLWNRYDQLYRDTFDKIKCGNQETTDKIRDSYFLFLPIRHNGFGLTSHAEIMEIAWIASENQSERFIDTLHYRIDQRATRFDGIQTQKEMSNIHYDQMAQTLIDSLNEKEKTVYFDNLNAISNAALYAIPRNKGMTLNNREMATLLHVRTLQPGSPLTICNYCGDENHLAHDLSCRSRINHATQRHHYLNQTLKQYIDTLQGTVKTTLEPTFPINVPGFRTDLHVLGRTAPNAVESEIDVKITSLLTVRNTNYTRSYRVTHAQELQLPESNESTYKQAMFEYTRIKDHILSKHEELKTSYYKDRIRHHFMPFLMSTGGHLGLQAKKWLKKITKKENLAAYNFFEMRVGVYLVKARTVTFDF